MHPRVTYILKWQSRKWGAWVASGSPGSLAGQIRRGWKIAPTLSGGCVGLNSSGEEVGLKPGCTDGKDRSGACRPGRNVGHL